MIKIAICENNMLNVAIIENSLEHLNYNSLEFHLYYNISELSAYQNSNYNLYIIDDEMISPSNIHLIEYIKNTNPEALFIYITNNEQYNTKSSDFKTFYCITKPITEKKTEYIIKKFLLQTISIEQSILLTYHQKLISIKYDDILYIETKKRHTFIIHTASKTYVSDYDSQIDIKNFAKCHDKYEFIQIHLNYIVNLKHVKTINLNNVILKNDEKLEISRAYRRIIKQKTE